MDLAIARVASTLAVWQAVRDEAGPIMDATNADLKSRMAHAFELFIEAAYELAFELVPGLLSHGKEITTRNEVRYSAVSGGGGFVLQKMDLDPDNPGVMLEPGMVSTENFLQLVIDLPELLETLQAHANK